MKNVLVILGHPHSDSFCGAIAKEYIAGSESAGNNVKYLEIFELKFNPIFKGYSEKQELEPDLIKAQELIKWADHLVFVFPTWWGVMPSFLHSFFERTFLPGFAFKYKENGFWDKYLKGKSAHIFTTMDGPKIFYWLIGSPGKRFLKSAILSFSGISPVKFTIFDRVKFSSDVKRKSWLNKVKGIASSFK